jgi:hypothetical protein
MNKIKLYNRDGANLWLENTGEQAAENIAIWKLNVDSKHKYCLEYIRVIGNYPYEIEAIDPSGGPMLSVGDVFENKYEIVKINSTNNIWIGERNNDN